MLQAAWIVATLLPLAFGLPELTEQQLEELSSIPYLSWTPVEGRDAGKQGVVRYEPGLSQAGFNIFNSPHEKRAVLMNMQGKIIHAWQCDDCSTRGWHHVELRENGDLLVIVPNGNILVTESDRGRAFEITREGKIVWEFLNPSTRRKGKERGAIYRMTRLNFKAPPKE